MLLIFSVFISFLNLSSARAENDINASLEGFKPIQFIDEKGNRYPTVIYSAGKDDNNNVLNLKVRLDCENIDNCKAHFFLNTNIKKSRHVYQYLFTVDYYRNELSPTRFLIKENLLAISGESHGTGRFAAHSNWVHKIQLSPLRKVSSYESSFGGMGGGEFDKTEISYSSGNASNSGSYYICSAESIGFEPVEPTASDLIPLVSLSKSSLSNWKNLNIDNCSVSPRFNIAKSTMLGSQAVLAVNPNLFLVDFLKESKTWIDDDYLEIWIASNFKEGFCHDNSKTKNNIEKFSMAQWRIFPNSGKVIRTEGNLKSNPKVQLAKIVKDKKVSGYRMKIEIPNFISEEGSISFSFKEGGRQTQLLNSTSRVDFGNAFSLGKLYKTACTDAESVLNWALPEISGDSFYKNKMLPHETEKNGKWPEKFQAGTQKTSF